MHACELSYVRPVDDIYSAFRGTWLPCRRIVVLTETDAANLKFAEENGVFRGELVVVQLFGIPYA